MDQWRGKVAVVTGASSGIGAAIVEALAAEGINVVGLARRKNLVEELANKNRALKGKIHAVECDITSEKSVSQAFDWIESKLGGVDILVNNAGTIRYCQLFDLAQENEGFLTTINTNLSGLFLVSRRAFKTMKDKPAGYMVNINSIAGHLTASDEFVKFGMNLYGATKHAVKELTRVMKLEFALNKRKIRITSISPGAVSTDIDVAGNWVVPGKRIWDLIPHLQPSDIAKQVLHVLNTDPSVQISELTIEPVGQMLGDL